MLSKGLLIKINISVILIIITTFSILKDIPYGKSSYIIYFSDEEQENYNAEGEKQITWPNSFQAKKITNRKKSE